tara:strand:+ start:28 stop:615 length:588 start_codon:yes stop_codon:yes gene_type:complete
MKQRLLLVLLLILAIKSFSQDSKFSIEASFPIPVGDNFLGKDYGGIIDIGIKYRFSELKIVNIGASINGGLLKNYKVEGIPIFDLNSYTIQPRIFAEFNIEKLSKLHPQIGLGYSFLIFETTKYNGTGNPPKTDSDLTEDGINLNLGLSYDITDKFFVQVQYDFIKIRFDKDRRYTPTKYNTNLSILKFGLGFRI